ncbi:MAG: hypothetical protein IJ752_04150 [Alphaproteobacteria bacterium]|nr:hypothetical protein [Alphaproteobacteria bacterium]
MAEKEIPEALSSLFEAVLAYQDTQEGLGRVRSVAQSMFGESWRAQLPGIIADCPDDLQQQVKTNIDRALTYEKAASIWTEVSRMLDPRRQIDAAQVKAQIPEMQRWLSIFGKAGQDLLAKLQDKIAQTEANPSMGSSVTANTYGLTVEQLWNFDHFMRLKTYYDQTISRTSARCVHLGGLELSQYPYFGYILDLLDEILTFGMEIITPPYAQIVRERYKGGEAALKKVLMEYKAEFDSNAPPEMLEDEETMDDIKNRLGSLADKNEVEEDIGPAPDGFEAPEETAVHQQAQPAGGAVKQPMVKAPQKMPVKAPVQAKMPVKRPVPAG